MRTPEQKVSHLLEALLKADAAYNRSTVAVQKAQLEKSSALQYAASALASANLRSSTSPAIEKARAAIAKAEQALEAAKRMFDSAARAHIENNFAKVGVEYAAAAVVTAESKHTMRVNAALLVQGSQKRKLDEAQSLYNEADDVVQHLARLDHAETLKANAEMLAEKSPEQIERQRKIAFEGGTNYQTDIINRNAN